MPATNDSRVTSRAVDPSFSPRRTLKRGALIAAANWPTIVIQASADAVFKVVVALPVVGGIVLAALVIGAEPAALLTLDVRDMGTTVFALLTARPATLAAFVGAVGTAVLGASTLAFLVKAGHRRDRGRVRTEHRAGRGSRSREYVAVSARFSVEQFNAAVRRFGPRFVRLGCGLLAAYALSGAAYFQVVVGAGSTGAWASAAAATASLVVWITVVNLLYLLAQVVMTAEDCGVLAACRRVVVLVARALARGGARVCARAGDHRRRNHRVAAGHGRARLRGVRPVLLAGGLAAAAGRLGRAGPGPAVHLARRRRRLRVGLSEQRSRTMTAVP